MAMGAGDSPDKPLWQTSTSVNPLATEAARFKGQIFGASALFWYESAHSMMSSRINQTGQNHGRFQEYARRHFRAGDCDNSNIDGWHSACCVCGNTDRNRYRNGIGADPIRTSYIRKTPKDERICQTQDVPVYGETAGNNESDLGAMIIGGVIGSAIGNKTSDNEGAGAAGAVVGALLGREHAKKNQGGGQQIIGYRQQEVCNIRTVMTEQTVEEITGYRVRIEVDGKIISLESKRPRNLGERVEINRKTTYSLR